MTVKLLPKRNPIMYKAIRKNPSAAQADPKILSALRDIPVSALSDNMHRNIGTTGLLPYQRPGKATMAGTAVTVRSRGGDNLTYLRALEFCRAGDVLVLDAGGDLNNAVVGGILSFYAATAGMAGLVIDGAIRDVAEIRERDFPVYARGVTHRGPYKDGPGEINVPVSVGGMVVNPGDIIVGDQDGLLAIPQDEVEQVIEKARAVLEAEAETMRAMKEGRWNRAFIDALEARCNN
jgi:RraA family protein